MEQWELTLILLLSFITLGQLTNNIAYNIPDPECTGIFNLCTDVDKERLGRLAIKAIHEQMDDDKDGMIEASESSDFIQEELESKADTDRHSRFQNADLQITLDDLWNQWKTSVVCNWTNDEVVDWLINHVHLPMYVENFRRNQIDGRMIPRIAVNEKHYLSSIMQIRDSRHKRRLMIKTMDIILFGPPKHTHNLVKDVIMMSALFLSVGACLYALVRHRQTQESMKQMLKDLETLQKAEGDLVAVTGKIKAMEYELKEKAKIDRGSLNSWFVKVQKAKEEADRFSKSRVAPAGTEKQFQPAIKEIEQLRIALHYAEEYARHQPYTAPDELISLLRHTCYLEEVAFEVKRKVAETEMFKAKEQMSKISKMQKGIFGAVRIAHTDCMDTVSELINSAKDHLIKIQNEYEERENRWNRIALLLDLKDLTCNSLSSTEPNNTNQYMAGLTNTAANNGINNNITDNNYRSKHISTDSSSTSSLGNDMPRMGKRNSHVHHRGLLLNFPQSGLTAIQDGFSHSDMNSDTSVANSPMTRGGINAENSLINAHHSNEGLNTMGTTISLNSLESNINSIGLARPQTCENLGSLSINKTGKPEFDLGPDLPSNINDTLVDEFNRKNSQSQLTALDDHQSFSTSDRTRKSFRDSKLFKSFSNIGRRTKNKTT